MICCWIGKAVLLLYDLLLEGNIVSLLYDFTSLN